MYFLLYPSHHCSFYQINPYKNEESINANTHTSVQKYIEICYCHK